MKKLRSGISCLSIVEAELLHVSVLMYCCANAAGQSTVCLLDFMHITEVLITEYTS